jgi:hypothetical protein
MKKKNIFKIMALAILITGFTNCLETTGKIVKDDAKDYIWSKYKKTVTQDIMTYLLGSQEKKHVFTKLSIMTDKKTYDTIADIFKQGIMKSDKSNSEKEQIIGELNDYENNKFIVYSISSTDPIILDIDKFNMAFEDANSINYIKNYRYHSYSTTSTNSKTGLTITSYVIQWLIKLEKPFTHKNFDKGKYQGIVIWPEGQEQIYEFEI